MITGLLVCVDRGIFWCFVGAWIACKFLVAQTTVSCWPYVERLDNHPAC